MSIGHLLFGITGRISRKQWWYGQLLAVVIAVVITFILHHSIPHTLAWWIFSPHSISFGTVLSIYYFWVHLALNIKRWHDLNKSGWYLLFNYLLPPVGLFISLIILGFFRGDTDYNRFGTVPD